MDYNRIFVNRFKVSVSSLERVREGDAKTVNSIWVFEKFAQEILTRSIQRRDS